MLICKRMKCFLLVSDTNEYSYDISCRPSKRRLIDSTNIHTPHKGIVDPWIHNISLARAIKHFNKCMRLRLQTTKQSNWNPSGHPAKCYGCVPPGKGPRLSTKVTLSLIATCIIASAALLGDLR